MIYVYTHSTTGLKKIFLRPDDQEEFIVVAFINFDTLGIDI